MGELDRGCSNNMWIWVILAFLLFSNNCGVSGIFDEFKCSSLGNLFSGNNWIWIAVLAFLFFNRGMC